MILQLLVTNNEGDLRKGNWFPEVRMILVRHGMWHGKYNDNWTELCRILYLTKWKNMDSNIFKF